MKIPRAIKTKKSIEELNIYFYEKYDEHFYFNKARSLWFLYHADEEIQNKFDSFSKDLNAYVNNTYDWRETLTAELYFTSFLQFEALFGLLTARFQESPHWIYLNNYSPNELKNNIKYFLTNDLSKLTNNLIEDKYNFINESIYSKQISPQDDSGNIWEKNLHNISFILKTIADKYIKSQIEFNGYKHGLRISKVAEAQLIIPGLSPIVASQTIGYLDIDTEEEDEKQILLHRIKSIDPHQSFYELYLMHRILKLVKMTRLLELEGKNLSMFENYPGEQLLFRDINLAILKGSSSMNLSLEL